MANPLQDRVNNEARELAAKWLASRALEGAVTHRRQGDTRRNMLAAVRARCMADELERLARLLLDGGTPTGPAAGG